MLRNDEKGRFDHDDRHGAKARCPRAREVDRPHHRVARVADGHDRHLDPLHAVPVLEADLGATTSQALWIINTYPLVMTGLLLATGTLGDRFGHKRVFQIGIASGLM